MLFNRCAASCCWELLAMKCRNTVLDKIDSHYIQPSLSTGYQRRQLLLQVACLTVLLLANNSGAAVLRRSCRRFQRNAGWFTNVWSTYSDIRLKETFGISRSTFMFLLGRIRNAIEKDTITEEPISLEARLAVCLYRLARDTPSL